MSSTAEGRKPVVDGLTIVAIAAIAMSLNVALHEGVHALTCLAVGSRLQAYSALYADCDSSTVWQMKAVAGAAPVYNLLAGTLAWLVLRRAGKASSEMRLFLWLFMIMNWFYGAGYFILSGATNIGDFAVVIRGWEPHALWRALLLVVGLPLYFGLVWLALRAFAGMAGGEGEEQMRRTRKLFTISYITAAMVVLSAGFFCPEGLLGLPVTAGLAAALGALSPLVWALRFFRSERIVKAPIEPLEIRRRWAWIGVAVVVVFLYAFVLGRTLFF
jgi:hypothetical protein